MRLTRGQKLYRGWVEFRNWRFTQEAFEDYFSYFLNFFKEIRICKSGTRTRQHRQRVRVWRRTSQVKFIEFYGLKSDVTVDIQWAESPSIGLPWWQYGWITTPDLPSQPCWTRTRPEYHIDDLWDRGQVENYHHCFNALSARRTSPIEFK